MQAMRVYTAHVPPRKVAPMPHLQPLVLINVSFSIPNWFFTAHTMVGLVIGLVLGYLIGFLLGRFGGQRRIAVTEER
jgi:hypothetical protein